MKRNISTRTILSLLALAGAALVLVALSLTTVNAGLAAPAATLICDDGDACFSYNGYWNPPSNPNQYCKYSGDMRFGYACWTSADCQPNNDNYSVFWRPYQVSGFTPGNYEVLTYISRCDSATPVTGGARYYLRHVGDSAATASLMTGHSINQAHPYQDNTDCSDGARWASLGVHYFDSTTYVELRAWTDESASQWGTRHHVIFADAMKFVYQGAPTPPPGPDINFRPNPDGYSFKNYGGVNLNDYTISDMRRMFGDAAVCIAKPFGVCIPRPSAVQWNINANKFMGGGRCDGMASTSLRFFKKLDQPSNFQANANTTYALQQGNVRRHIAYYFVEQLTNPVRAYKEQIRKNTPSAILNQLCAAMQGGAPDPTTLFVRQNAQGGHAITPYAIEDRGNGVYWVRVYDNNHPNDANRYVVINTVNNTWSYNLGSTTWSGNASSHTLGIVPISKYAARPVCPWYSSASSAELADWARSFAHHQ